MNEQPVCRVCATRIEGEAALDPDKPSVVGISYLHPECARRVAEDAARRRAMVRVRLEAAAQTMLNELDATVAWLEEQAAVIEKHAAEHGMKAMRKFGIVAARMRGRAELIRQVAKSATGT